METPKLITYDLCNKNKNYNELYQYFQSLKTIVKITESALVVKTALSCVQLRDAMKALIDSDDRLSVCALTGEAAWQNVICGTENFKKYL